MEALTLTEEPRVITASEPPYEIRHTNKAWHKLTGYKFTEVAHTPNHFLQGPGTEKEELGKLKEGVSQAKHTRVRVLNYTKDGAPFYNTIECHPLRDTSGTLTHFCGVLKGEPVPDLPKLDREPPLPKRDPIQKPPESPSSSRRSKRMKGRTMLADALNNKHDAVILTEAKEPWRILHVNQPWCEMCGYTLEARSSPAVPLPAPSSLPCLPATPFPRLKPSLCSTGPLSSPTLAGGGGPDQLHLAGAGDGPRGGGRADEECEARRAGHRHARQLQEGRRAVCQPGVGAAPLQ